jgi:hypothetical protein
MTTNSRNKNADAVQAAYQKSVADLQTFLAQI